MTERQPCAMFSQPLANKTEEEIIRAREKATEVLKAMGYNVVNVPKDDPRYDAAGMQVRGIVQVPLYYLVTSLENMCRCDAAYFCKGWAMSRGCRIENAVARSYGLDVIYEDAMPFEAALKAARLGHSVARAVWNEHGVFVKWICRDREHKGGPVGLFICEQRDGEKVSQVPWAADSEALLATDWVVLTDY